MPRGVLDEEIPAKPFSTSVWVTQSFVVLTDENSVLAVLVIGAPP